MKRQKDNRKQGGGNWVLISMTILIAFILTFLIISSL
jgi:hypothetical protein